MKRIISFAIVMVLVIPNLALASWWNPLSWFSRNPTVNKIELPSLKGVGLQEQPQFYRALDNSSATSSKSTKYYVKYNNSRVRKCASTTNCEVEGYFTQNQELSFSGPNSSTLEVLPEWLEVNFSDGRMGYINKLVLSETPISKEITIPNTTKEVNTTDASLPLKFSGALVELFTMAKSNMEFARKSINEISQSTKERRDFLVKMNSSNDIYFNQLIEIDTDSIKKNEGYAKAFDNGIYFVDSFLPTIEKYKNDIMSGNREYDIPTYNTLFVFYFESYKKTQKSLDDVWGNFISSYDTASKTRDSISTMMKAAHSVSNQVNYTQILSPNYIPSVPAIPALPLQKTINCTMGQMSGARAYYTVSCY